MRLFKIAVPIAALVAAVFILYTKFFSVSEAVPSAVVTESNASVTNQVVSVESAVENLSETQATQTDSATQSDSANGDTLASAAGDESVGSGELTTTASEQTPQIDYPDLFGYEVGVADISEEDFTDLVKRLRNDPTLLADVLNELRAETDPARLKRLTIMLGATGSADVLPVAEELIYSSDSTSRKTGLDLLSRVAPQNPAAYEIANSILSSEADPKILVSTMNVLARPKNAGPEAKATAVSQIMPLANHESAAVRRHSVGMLTRLTNDESLSPVLYNALSDSDASVREAATYAYAGYPYQTDEAVQRLMELIEDPSEERGVRSGAMLAISNMSPDELTKQRIKAAKIQMREAPK